MMQPIIVFLLIGIEPFPQLPEEVKDMNALHIAHTTIEGVKTDDYQTCSGIVFSE